MLQADWLTDQKEASWELCSPLILTEFRMFWICPLTMLRHITFSLLCCSRWESLGSGKIWTVVGRGRGKGCCSCCCCCCCSAAGSKISTWILVSSTDLESADDRRRLLSGTKQIQDWNVTSSIDWCNCFKGPRPENRVCSSFALFISFQKLS